MTITQTPTSSAATQPDAASPAPRISPVGGPVWVAWREGILARAEELEGLCEWIEREHPERSHEALTGTIRNHLAAAREAARCKKLKPHRRFRVFRNGPLIERATSNLDKAWAFLLDIAPADYVIGQMPCLLMHVQCHLPANDPRRREFECVSRRLGIGDPDRPSLATDQDPTIDQKRAVVYYERHKITAVVRAACAEALREHIRLRSFRNIVVTTSVLLSLLVVGIAITGFVRPTLIPMCFAPEEAGTAVVVCPTGESEPFVPLGAPPQSTLETEDIDDVVADTVSPADLLVVELVGLTAAAIAVAAAIRRIEGSSERYGLPVALAALKLPTGAITAFLGLLLIRGQFVPGLSALDTPAQILAWALLFGYAQELFTRLVDQQGQTVLNRVRGADKSQTAPSAT